MVKYIIALLLVSCSVNAELVSGKDGSNENVLNVDANGQITSTLPAFDFQEITSSATDADLGGTGALGEYLDHCQCQVITSGANGTCGIEDGSNTAYDDITVVPASTPIGTYPIVVEAAASTSEGWEVSTGSAATMQCYGYFD